MSPGRKDKHTHMQAQIIYGLLASSVSLYGVTFRHGATYSVTAESPPAPPGDGSKSSGETAILPPGLSFCKTEQGWQPGAPSPGCRAPKGCRVCFKDCRPGVQCVPDKLLPWEQKRWG